MEMEKELDDLSIAAFILGEGKAVSSFTKEQLMFSKLAGDHVIRTWCECFVKVLITNKFQVQDFVNAYLMYIEGDKDKINQLNLLPDRLKKNKRLALIYLEAIFYVTLKRDLIKLSKPLPPVLERIGDPEYA